ncbi:2333_t:CDS:2 [Cetraspora pellucida]|uniref:2333_t:CDS:1 n=1 Tax=Cetraspora pellucida TaxID=1433469 RepID=A0A9N9EAQ2_9GLOM|nr:2333_t:CDS:2 [Cetraspora pellucida]
MVEAMHEIKYTAKIKGYSFTIIRWIQTKKQESKSYAQVNKNLSHNTQQQAGQYKSLFNYSVVRAEFTLIGSFT